MKALAAFFQLRRVAGKTWGTTPKVTHWIYTAVLRLMLCYPAVIWWTCTQYVTVSKQLEHLQRLACLYIAGAKRTVPTAALEIITGIVPLPVYIKRAAMATCFRLKLNSQWVQTTGGHSKIKRILATNIPLSSYALLICAKLESLLHRKNCSIAICSDSLAAINAALAHKATSGLVTDAMSALKILAIYNSLRLIWVPGPCGIAGNEKADALAKQASASYFTGPELSVGISVSTIYSSINK